MTWSCDRRFPFLSRELSRQWLVDAIGHARQALQFDVCAWVFMPDHAHLIVRPQRDRYRIAAIRRLIKEPVARQAIAWIRQHAPVWLPRIERRGTRTEHLLWQSGGEYDRNITAGKTLLNMIDYIHENPVRKGLVVRGRDWKWSSTAWYVDQSTVPLLPDNIAPHWLADATSH